MPNWKQLLIDIDPELHLTLKRLALETGKTLRDVVTAALNEYLGREPITRPAPKRGRTT